MTSFGAESGAHFWKNLFVVKADPRKMENSDTEFVLLNILSQMTSSINFSSSRNVKAVLHFV